MAALFRYWFLIIAAAGPAIALYLYIRLRAAAGDDLHLQRMAVKIAWVTFGIVSVPALFNALLQHLGGFADGNFIFSNDFTNPIVVVAWFEPLVTAAVLTWWAWRTQGPAILVRFREVFTRLPQTARGIQWFATIVGLPVVAKRTYDVVSYFVQGGPAK